MPRIRTRTPNPDNRYDPAPAAQEQPYGPETPDPGPVDPDASAAVLDPLTQAAVDAASLPLPELDDPEDVVAAVADGKLTPADAIAAVVSADPLSRLMAGHERTVAAVERIARLDENEEERGFAARVAEESLAAIRDLAARTLPDLPAPVVTVNVPEQPVTVNVDAPVVNVPEQPAPVVTVEAPQVHVAAPEAPHVDVHVAAPEAPVVNVAVPQQPAPAAPVVHVHPAPPPSARKMVVQENPVTGVRTFTFDDDEDDG